ncbi:hypothetical protein GLOIN_2v1787213 [Rhizophagus clarus]|uniref:Uncharacterized protein n=1 Tax=Rhizophagus clarus TaxID=94130 RepID=A0A8H3QWC5_9GLOM|nr:hypothetical protein GLOIN_2v1787213 [Rhizophagus clarus]
MDGFILTIEIGNKPSVYLINNTMVQVVELSASGTRNKKNPESLSKSKVYLVVIRLHCHEVSFISYQLLFQIIVLFFYGVKYFCPRTSNCSFPTTQKQHDLSVEDVYDKDELSMKLIVKDHNADMYRVFHSREKFWKFNDSITEHLRSFSEVVEAKEFTYHALHVLKNLYIRRFPTLVNS